MWSSVVKIISLIKLDQSRLVSDISQRQRLDMWCMKTMGKETEIIVKQVNDCAFQ